MTVDYEMVGKLASGVCPKCGDNVISGPQGVLVMKCLGCGGVFRKPQIAREVLGNQKEAVPWTRLC